MLLASVSPQRHRGRRLVLGRAQRQCGAGRAAVGAAGQPGRALLFHAHATPAHAADRRPAPTASGADARLNPATALRDRHTLPLPELAAVFSGLTPHLAAEMMPHGHGRAQPRPRGDLLDGQPRAFQQLARDIQPGPHDPIRPASCPWPPGSGATCARSWRRSRPDRRSARAGRYARAAHRAPGPANRPLPGRPATPRTAPDRPRDAAGSPAYAPPGWPWPARNRDAAGAGTDPGPPRCPPTSAAAPRPHQHVRIDLDARIPAAQGIGSASASRACRRASRSPPAQRPRNRSTARRARGPGARRRSRRPAPARQRRANPER